MSDECFVYASNLNLIAMLCYYYNSYTHNFNYNYGYNQILREKKRGSWIKNLGKWMMLRDLKKGMNIEDMASFLCAKCGKENGHSQASGD